MRCYELRFLNRSDIVVLRQAYMGPDDIAALNEAKRLSATHTIEVWEADRKIARLKREDVPPIRADRPSG